MSVPVLLLDAKSTAMSIRTYVDAVKTAVDLSFRQYKGRVQISQTYSKGKGPGSFKAMNFLLDPEGALQITHFIEGFANEVLRAPSIEGISDKLQMSFSYRDREAGEYKLSGYVTIGYNEKGIFLVVTSKNEKHADFPVVTHFFKLDQRLINVCVAANTTMAVLKNSAFVALQMAQLWRQGISEVIRYAPLLRDNDNKGGSTGGGNAGGYSGGGGGGYKPAAPSDMDDDIPF